MREVDSWLGRTLCETYQLEQLIGQGGMGAVFRARHLRTGGLVAIKKMLLTTESDWRRFDSEAKVVAALNHPHIVQIYDYFHENGFAFIVMEMLRGEDLHQRLQRCGTLTIPEILQLSTQSCDALRVSHQQGIVHRDIKPQNLFIIERRLAGQDSLYTKILDFGIAKVRRTVQLTPAVALMGTPHYMSPEAALGQISEVDERADQYSLAVLLYRAIAGTLPFEGEEPLAILHQVINQPAPRLSIPGIPAAVGEVLARALSKKKEQRFASIQEFALAVVEACQGCGPRKSPSKNAKLAIDSALGLCVVGTTAVASFVTGLLSHSAVRNKPNLSTYYSESGACKQVMPAPRLEKLNPDEPLVYAGVAASQAGILGSGKGSERAKNTGRSLVKKSPKPEAYKKVYVNDLVQSYFTTDGSSRVDNNAADSRLGNSPDQHARSEYKGTGEPEKIQGGTGPSRTVD